MNPYMMHLQKVEKVVIASGAKQSHVL